MWIFFLLVHFLLVHLLLVPFLLVQQQAVLSAYILLWNCVPFLPMTVDVCKVDSCFVLIFPFPIQQLHLKNHDGLPLPPFVQHYVNEPDVHCAVFVLLIHTTSVHGKVVEQVQIVQHSLVQHKQEDCWDLFLGFQASVQ